MISEWEIRCDDVLICRDQHTRRMEVSTWTKPLFEWFKEIDSFFAEKNVPMILAVMADGIDKYPEWVSYIKENQHRYTIQMHGLTHENYNNFTEIEAYAMLKYAKEKIEETFNIKVTRWYVPFSKRAFPEWGERVCRQLGISLHTRGGKARHFYFHYWNPLDHKRIKTIVNMELSGTHINPKSRFSASRWLQTQEGN